MKTVLAAAAITTATFALASPAHAIVRDSVPTHITITANSPLPKGIGTITVHLSADNGKVPEDAIVQCAANRDAGGGWPNQRGGAVVDNVTGDAQVPMTTPTGGAWTVSCYWQPAHAWTIYIPTSGIGHYTVVDTPTGG